MPVAIRRLANLASEQLVDGKVCLSALDIPQCLVDAAYGVIQHAAVTPVRAVVHRLPGIIDSIGLLSDHEWLQVFVDGSNDNIGALCEGRASITIQTVLIGEDLTTIRRTPPGCV